MHGVRPSPNRADAMSRNYSAEEAAALLAAGLTVARGPAQFAGGDWWPAELEARAAKAEALVPKLRLAASALRREIALDPLTRSGVGRG